MTTIPNIKLRAVVSLPSEVRGGTGIDVTQSAGVYTFDLDYSEMAVYASVPATAAATTYYLGWNSLNDQYGLVPIQSAGTVTKIPVTVTAATYSVLEDDSSIIVNFAGTCTVTLPAAATYPGRWLQLKTLTANTVVSAASNVGALATGTAGTAILAAVAGRWARLQSDGTNWQIMAAN